MSTVPLWSLPLGERPHILGMGVDVRGELPTERYELGDWCLHVYRYHGVLEVEGVQYPFGPGHASLLAPNNVLVHHIVGRSEHIFVHFALQEEAYESVEVPMLIDLGDSFETIYRALEDSVLFWLRGDWTRADVRLWDALFLIAEAPHTSGRNHRGSHWAVSRAVELIEQRLDGPIDVSALARELSISHSQLTRAFRAALGTTVVEYVRHRRVERARHLLTRSSLPVKAIARQVGLPDLQRFNKTIRRETGYSPRALRSEFSAR